MTSYSEAAEGVTISERFQGLTSYYLNIYAMEY